MLLQVYSQVNRGYQETGRYMGVDDNIEIYEDWACEIGRYAFHWNHVEYL